jgi:hypothetical protein
MKRMMAIVEREMRKFFRSPVLMIMSMMLPLVQLVILGTPLEARSPMRAWAWWITIMGRRR